MTAATELSYWETMYAAWIQAGAPQSYSIGNRTFTRASFEQIVKRIDQLRAEVARQTDGAFYAGQFRSQE